MQPSTTQESIWLLAGGVAGKLIYISDSLFIKINIKLIRKIRIILKTQIQITDQSLNQPIFFNFRGQDFLGWIHTAWLIPYVEPFYIYLDWIPRILGFLNPANETSIWISQILELQKSFTMIPNTNQFSGTWASKINFLTFVWAFE